MIKIHTEIYGQGQPLVLIHGWSMHTGIWRQFALTLAQSFQVICVDLPGHGRSASVMPYQLESISEILAAAIPVQKFHLLGWSLGATVALDLIRRYPVRVASLTMLAANPCFVQNKLWPGIQSEVLRSFAANLKLNGQATLMRFLALQVNGLSDRKPLLKLLKAAVQECEPPTVEVLQGGLEILRSADLTSVITAAYCPLLYLLGDQDPLIPLSCSDHVKHLKPEIETAMLHNAGHLPFLSHQAEIQTIIRSFCYRHAFG